jgi:hypothetical protein
MVGGNKSGFLSLKNQNKIIVNTKTNIATVITIL